MITRNELIQKRVDFWKTYFLEQCHHDLDKTIGLVKSMVNSAYVHNGENDDTGLYHSLLLAEDRLYEFSNNRLDKLINQITLSIIEDIESLNNESA